MENTKLIEKLEGVLNAYTTVSKNIELGKVDTENFDFEGFANGITTVVSTIQDLENSNRKLY